MVPYSAALDLPHALVEWVTTPYCHGLWGIGRHRPRPPAVTGLLAEQAPGRLKMLRAHDSDFVLLDGTLAECDRVGDGRADCSSKHKRHGVNVQVV